MKLLHIADLHIGKRVKGYLLIEDQKAVLGQVIDTIKKEKIDGIIIAGDIYDVSNPSNEAVNLFDNFISEINKLNVSVFAVSGNHDSIYRIAFGSNIMAKQNVYFAKRYNGTLEYIDLKDEVRIWLLPFIRPVDVREYHADFKIGSYEDMMKAVLSDINIDKTKINILAAHQFITCNGKEPEKCDSETVSLGTLDNIDVSIFNDFDYIALGHIHKPQAMGRKTAVYAGSPLKYSFSEKNDKKSMVLLNIQNKNIEPERILFNPIKDMKEFKGSYDELVKNKCNDYVRIVLTDEDFIPDVRKKLEYSYPNIMEIAYDNTYTKQNNETGTINITSQMTPFELFKIFYEKQNNKPMNNEQEEIIQKIFEESRNCL